MLQLLPSVEHETDAGLILQTYLADVLKSLVRSERNQQVMCDAGNFMLIFAIQYNFTWIAHFFLHCLLDRIGGASAKYRSCITN